MVQDVEKNPKMVDSKAQCCVIYGTEYTVKLLKTLNTYQQTEISPAMYWIENYIYIYIYTN